MKSLYLTSLLLLSLLALSACVPRLSPPVPPPLESGRFEPALDQYLATGDSTLLQELVRSAEKTQWNLRAAKLLGRDQKQQQQLNLLKKKLAQQQHSSLKKELKRCQEETTALKGDNKLLEETLTQLKKLLIDNELKTK